MVEFTIGNKMAEFTKIIENRRKMAEFTIAKWLTRLQNDLVL
jgi:hypothetical protein